MSDDGGFTPAIVCQHVAAHDYAIGSRLQPSGVSLTHFGLGMGKINHLLLGHRHSSWVRVDADHCSGRPDALGQQSQDGARTAPDVSHGRPWSNACPQPLCRFVFCGDGCHHPIARPFLVAERQAVADGL